MFLITEVESVYSAVRIDSLYKADYVWSLNSRLESVYNAVRPDSLYKADYVWSLNSRLESVYSAVRTDSLYKADYVWSLNSRLESVYSAVSGCLRRNVPDFGRVFLMLKYTDISQNTFIQS